MDLRDRLIAELKLNLQRGGSPVIPAGGTLLWRWFLDLNRGRTYHASGPNPISYTEIGAYASLRRWPMDQHHIDILIGMDSAYLESFYSKGKKTENGAKVLPVRSDQAINPAVFDAVFG